jgi:hypothetical protein
MSVVVTPASIGRTVRLTALVSSAEAAEVAKLAAAAGMSVSAYLRERALGDGHSDTDEQAAIRQVDAAIDRMEADLDSAIAVLSGTIARIDGT